jgi:hypothetical protein
VKARFAALSPRATVALCAGGILLYSLLLFVFYVSPKRSEPGRLQDEIAAAELRLAEAQAAVKKSPTVSSPASEIFRLAKAMPSSSDQPGLVLELTRLAERTGVTLRAITSQPSAAGTGGATMVPVVVTIGGSYREITRFLNRTRTLVAVRRGRVRATGRLFAVEGVELAESVTRGFPELDATITLDAYVYDGPIVPPEVPSAEEDSSDGETPSATGATPAGATG